VEPLPLPLRPSQVDVSAAVRDSEALRTARARLEAAVKGVETLRSTTAARIDAMHQNMEGLLERLKDTDARLDARLAVVEAALREQMRAVGASHAAASRGWVVPFAVLAVIVGVLVLVGWRQYRQIMKMHLL
jgi:cytochrome c-type biogenesis protein CcmH/NrfG